MAWFWRGVLSGRIRGRGHLFHAVPIAVLFNDVYFSIKAVQTPNSNATSNTYVVVDRKLRREPRKLRNDDLIVFISPIDAQMKMLRIKALPKEWVWSRNKLRQVPIGSLWVEAEAGSNSVPDSNTFGPLPFGMIQGRVVCQLWPEFRRISYNNQPVVGNS